MLSLTQKDEDLLALLRLNARAQAEQAQRRDALQSGTAGYIATLRIERDGNHKTI